MHAMQQKQVIPEIRLHCNKMEQLREILNTLANIY